MSGSSSGSTKSCLPSFVVEEEEEEEEEEDEEEEDEEDEDEEEDIFSDDGEVSTEDLICFATSNSCSKHAILSFSSCFFSKSSFISCRDKSAEPHRGKLIASR